MTQYRQMTFRTYIPIILISDQTSQVVIETLLGELRNTGTIRRFLLLVPAM
jgi:hypothetical protein